MLAQYIDIVNLERSHSSSNEFNEEKYQNKFKKLSEKLLSDFIK